LNTAIVILIKTKQKLFLLTGLITNSMHKDLQLFKKQYKFSVSVSQNDTLLRTIGYKLIIQY